MCGITAVINGSEQDVRKMSNAISRRGKESFFWTSGNIHIAFEWLPITDHTLETPYFESGNYTVFLNGYISNWKELAEKYDIEVQSNCDTELLARFLDRFHEDKINELNGFFSIVYVLKNKLYCITDRWGIKQLYIAHKEDKSFISSEVKGILALQDYKWELSEFGVNDWKHSLGVMNDHTIYRDIFRVPKLNLTIPDKIDINYEDAKKKLKMLFMKSIERNRIADLNTCVFLSGGVDSGIIAKHIEPNYCFSVDYLSEEFSEINTIKANSIGEHFILLANDSIYDRFKNKTLNALDDPKVGSCYTNFALTEFASKFATVIYSGAGGDELFGGYPHRNAKNIEDVICRSKYDAPEYPLMPNHFEYDLLYLQGVLIVEDRMAGHHCMETRYPLLDNDFAEFALSLPDEYLKNKRILKDISGLPEEVINAPKWGFSNPHCTNLEWIDFVLLNLKENE